MSPEEKLKTLLGLWVSENSIKTNKLNYFLIVQSILISILSLNAAIKLHLVISLIGIIVSIILFFSIGRTIAFQQIWEHIIKDILKENKESGIHKLSSVFEKTIKFPLYGVIPSKYLVLFPPVFTTVLWTTMFIYQIVNLLSR